jgi:hypothetical protein
MPAKPGISNHRASQRAIAPGDNIEAATERRDYSGLRGDGAARLAGATV